MNAHFHARRRAASPLTALISSQIATMIFLNEFSIRKDEPEAAGNSARHSLKEQRYRRRRMLWGQSIRKLCGRVCAPNESRGIDRLRHPSTTTCLLDCRSVPLASGGRAGLPGYPDRARRIRHHRISNLPTELADSTRQRPREPNISKSGDVIVKALKDEPC